MDKVVFSAIFSGRKHFRGNVDFNLHHVFPLKNADNKIYLIRIEKPERNR
jgi:hypothetical protein